MTDVSSSDYQVWIEYLESGETCSFEKFKRRKECTSNRQRNEMMNNDLILYGHTTPIKEELKVVGCTWNPTIRKWIAPTEEVRKQMQEKIDLLSQKNYDKIASSITSTNTQISKAKRRT